MPTLELDGRSVHYDDGGDGPPLVLSHGAIESTRSWDDVAAILRARFRVVAYDARGRGRSDLAPVEYPAMARDVAALAERLQLGRFFHAGHSMGGRVVVEHALARPQDILGAAAVSARVEGSDEATRAKLDALIDDVRRDGPGAAARMWIAPEHPLYERVREISAANPLEGTVAAIGCARDAGPLDPAGLAVPVLAVVGAEDTRYIPSARAIGGELQVLDGIGHFPNLEAPALLAQLLTDFFSRYV